VNEDYLIIDLGDKDGGMSLVRLAEAGLSEECKMKLIKYSISYQQEKAVFFFL